MAHTVLDWSHGRGSITVDGVKIPRVLSVSMDLSASDPLGVITIRVLADEVTAQVVADTVVTSQPEQRIDDLNDQLAKLNAELTKLDLLNAQLAKRIAESFTAAGSTKGLALLVRKGEQQLHKTD